MRVRPADAERFVDRPPADCPIILLYGPDAGLIAERAERLAAGALAGHADAFSLVRLTSDEIATDPGRLSDEAHALSLFGGGRVIRLKVAGNRSILPAVEALVERPPRDCLVIIEGGDLKRGAPLRQRLEAAGVAAVIACYPDEQRDLDRLIADELAATGATIDDDARAALRHLLGGDRLASRGEIRKLALYAGPGGRIDRAAVQAVVADASMLAVDDLIDSVCLGDVEAADRHYRRLLGSGMPAAAIATTALRRLQALHRGQAALAAGAAPEAAIGLMRVPAFGPRRGIVEHQLRRWRGESAAGLARLSAAIAESRRLPLIADAVIGNALIALAAAGPRPAAGRLPAA